ncbi:antitoxin VbhA family protein [Bifidobacterium tibiigranuli]|jgi:hypothetical protein|uniref:antitoxin VbhA family protein n=1 Tax=Bifidobacterium tibiigranuli TaxID=2172043 RepID=UPI0026EE6D1E|nr:antitoxin VbhA family protein [Bifidobacterium tibiigranuli]MCI1650606.1 hypothetical protein [Bifidobacterium tibiigranuli]MCI2185335.1 hypothetical protein [Bifidobacterium tibiigranuli]MCI2203690.1 hypothetical protein [Bifidobacterium tibiigranuli]
MPAQLTKEQLAENVYQSVHSVEMEGGSVSPEFMAEAREYVNGRINVNQWKDQIKNRLKAKYAR